ncbi:MAG: hypothetical protein F6J95_026240 [Leptolyngbya sp. SIO1E4]|nr:hypothetical protein [Leptolyngbya sp. SIO1E4]
MPEWPDFEGQRLADTWQIPRMKIKNNKPIANFTDIDPGILICDSFALENLGEALESEVEVLSIENVDKIDMYILNVVNLIDCLDEDNSEIEYFSSGRIMNIQSYSFFTENLNDTMLFKIPQFSRTEIFSTDSCRNQVLRSSLTGLTFAQVYSS